MALVERQALVPYQPVQMFDLVNDVERYPQFLKGCVGARVDWQTEQESEASITLSLGGLQQTFSTRNRLQRPEELRMQLLSGPFRRLEGAWRFRALGEEGCQVGLHLEFEFSNRVLHSAFAGGFSQVAERLVSEFCRRADQCYGG